MNARRFMHKPAAPAEGVEAPSGSEAQEAGETQEDDVTVDEVAPVEESAGEEGGRPAKVAKVQCGKCGHSFVGEFRDVTDLYAPEGDRSAPPSRGFTEVPPRCLPPPLVPP